MATNCNCCSCVIEGDYGTSIVSGEGTQSDPFQIFQTDPGWVRPMVRVTKDTQSIPNDTDTAISFNSAVFDTNTMWNSGDPTRLTINTGGLFIFGATGAMGFNATGIREYSFRVNGLNTIDFTNKVQPTPEEVSHVYIYPLQASDYLEFMVRQTSGAPLAFGGTVAINDIYFWACYLGKVV